MSEICQSCCRKILTEPVPAAFSTALMKSVGVEFDVVGGVWRRWRMCESCAQTLQNMVLGFMGELAPGDEPGGEVDEPLTLMEAVELLKNGSCTEYLKALAVVEKYALGR